MITAMDTLWRIYGIQVLQADPLTSLIQGSNSCLFGSHVLLPMPYIAAVAVLAYLLPDQQARAADAATLGLPQHELEQPVLYMDTCSDRELTNQDVAEARAAVHAPMHAYLTCVVTSSIPSTHVRRLGHSRLHATRELPC